MDANCVGTGGETCVMAPSKWNPSNGTLTVGLRKTSRAEHMPGRQRDVYNAKKVAIVYNVANGGGEKGVEEEQEG